MFLDGAHVQLGVDERPKTHQELVLERHAQWNTPFEVIQHAVVAASGAPVARSERLYGGEANEVHAVWTTTGHELVVRIAHREHRWFEGETWILEQCRSAGLPVPDVLHLEHVDQPDENLSICVQRRLPGEQMHQAGFTPELIVQAGRLLAQLHQVPVAGIGAPDGHGAFKAQTLDEILLDDVAVRAIPQAVDCGISSEVAGRALAHLEEHRPLVARLEPRLVHGDYGPKHLLVADGMITGILDFERSRGSDPAEDFAWWDFYYDRPPHPSSLMLQGYRQVADTGEHLDLRRHLFRLVLGLWALGYYTDMRSIDAASMCRRHIERDVEWLQHPS